MLLHLDTNSLFRIMHITTGLMMPHHHAINNIIRTMVIMMMTTTRMIADPTISREN